MNAKRKIKNLRRTRDLLLPRLLSAQKRSLKRKYESHHQPVFRC